MKYLPSWTLVPAVAMAAATFAPACSSGFSRVGPNAQLVVTRTAGDPGTSDKPLPLSFVATKTFTFHLEAHKPDGSVDTSFNGYVRASIKPGTVVSVTGPNTDGRNVQLVNGAADAVAVEVVAAYGNSRIWFEDMGYTPADPVGDPPPQCSNGKDDNGNGLVDFPADPGCAFANDDSENTGTFATGTSDTIFFAAPRVADVRGIATGGNGTPFPHDQVQMDTGWRGGDTFAWSTIVTRIASDGFYVTDLQNDIDDPAKRPGYGSVFAFTYSPPPLMRVCDRLKIFGGTASDFFGFTEMSFPTWLLEEWDPTQRPCMVPEPHVLTLAEYADNASMFRLEASLVRVLAAGSVSMHVASKFGPGYPTKETNFAPTADATNCDFNRNGKIEFTGGDEQFCAAACDGGTLADGTMGMGDPECSEYSSFASQSNFNLTVTDTSTMPSAMTAKVNVNASADATFDPVSAKGQPIKSFTGTVRYFSGGSQWTIEARCEDDIITDPNGAPISSEKACVHARTISDTNDQSH